MSVAMRLPSRIGTMTLRSIMATDSRSCSVVLRLASCSFVTPPRCWAWAVKIRVRKMAAKVVAIQKEARAWVLDITKFLSGSSAQCTVFEKEPGLRHYRTNEGPLIVRGSATAPDCQSVDRRGSCHVCHVHGGARYHRGQRVAATYRGQALDRKSVV